MCQIVLCVSKSMTYAPILLGICMMVGPVDHQGVFYSTAAKMRANRWVGGLAVWPGDGSGSAGLSIL